VPISRTRQLAIGFALVFIAGICPAIEPLHDGSTAEKAIVVAEQSIEKCVDAEHAYIHSHYPAVLLDGFEHVTIPCSQGGLCDLFRFTTKDGKRHELYFDSSRCK
jgi:hypothetical protein